jgi:hypothetical protein
MKKVTATSVSRLLSKNNFTKSESYSSGMIRGWKNITRGFRCKNITDKNETQVLVSWNTGGYSQDSSQEQTYLNNMFEVLVQAYGVERVIREEYKIYVKNPTAEG